MCGIAGLIGRLTPAHHDALGRMNAALAHRGPDDSGIWADPAAGVVLAHRRLSILDLSPEGHQPMVSADGRFQQRLSSETGDVREPVWSPSPPAQR